MTSFTTQMHGPSYGMEIADATPDSAPAIFARCKEQIQTNFQSLHAKKVLNYIGLWEYLQNLQEAEN